jgi:membrane-bound lytic murein transglycosylase D
MASIQEWNRDLNLKDLAPGQSVVLWVPRNARILEVASAQASSFDGKRQEITYTIRRGDTLSSIARHYQVSVADIMSWNNLSAGKRLRPGDRLRVFPSIRIDAYHGELPPTSVED